MEDTRGEGVQRSAGIGLALHVGVGDEAEIIMMQGFHRASIKNLERAKIGSSSVSSHEEVWK